MTGNPRGRPRVDRAPTSENGLPGVSAELRLRPGSPAAHGEDRLRLLPSGPDLVHGTPSRGTWPSTPQLGVLALRAEPSGGSSAPLERVSGYRAPLTPHLARSVSKPSRVTGSMVKRLLYKDRVRSSHIPIEGVC